MWLLRVWARKTLKQRWLSWKSWAPCAWFLAATRRFCRPCCTTRSMPAKGPAFRWALWQLPLCLCCFELCLHKHLCRLAGSVWLDVSRCWLLSCHFKHSLPLKVKFQRIEYTLFFVFSKTRVWPYLFNLRKKECSPLLAHSLTSAIALVGTVAGARNRWGGPHGGQVQNCLICHHCVLEPTSVKPRRCSVDHGQSHCCATHTLHS